MSNSGRPSHTVKAERSPSNTHHASRSIKKQLRSPSPPAPTTYRDIPLLSTSSTSPWLHHLIRFAHHNRTDPTDHAQFLPPLKLNRKHPPRIKAPAPKPGDAVVDRYGKPIRISNGSILKWPSAGEDLTEHRTQVDKLKPPAEKSSSTLYDASLVAPSAATSSRSYAHKGKGQKRVRQIHKASATARRIHNDETLPWILEDYETGNHWESTRVGRKDSIFALATHLEQGGTGLSHHSAGQRMEGGPVEEEAVVKKEGQEDVKTVDAKVFQHAPWIGKLEGDDASLSSAASSSAQVLFIFDERNQGGFKVVPIRKTYRFIQRSRFVNEMGDEEREKEYARQQKSRELAPGKFVTRMTNGAAPGTYPLSRPGSGSSVTSSGMGYGSVGLPGVFASSGRTSSSGNPGTVRIKKEEELDDESWPELRGLSLNTVSSRPRGLVAVSGGASRGRRRGGEDDDVDYSHRRGGDDGGTYDELDYQEDFADDEERMGGEAELVEDNEAREMEDRIKREMAKAGFGGEEEDEEHNSDGQGGGEIDAPQGNMWGEASSGAGRRREDDQLTGSGKQMKKIMKALAKREGNTGEEYESDEEYNPYVSDDEEEEEEVAMANPEEAMRLAKEDQEREEKEAARLGKATANASSAATPSGGTTSLTSTTPSGKNSRGTTPLPATQQTSKPNSPAKNKHKNLPRTSSSSASMHRAGSGHADLAKRATTNISASTGGPSGGGVGSARSRGGSPHASRSPSPSRGTESNHLPRQSSPLAGVDPSNVPSGGGVNSGGMSASGSLKRPASPSTLHTATFQGPGMSGSGSSSSLAPSSSTTNKDSAKRMKTSPSSSRPSSPPAATSGHLGTNENGSGPLASVTALENELISLVRGGAVKSIAEVIARFKRRLQERPELKTEMMAAFKRVLTGGTKGEALRVKEGY